MKLRAPFLTLLSLSALHAALTGCAGHECLQPPCPLPLAITVTVTDAATGGPLNGATLHVSGATTATIPCNTLCYVPGTAGTYVLEVGAPGFQSRRLTLAVEGTTPECGCPTVVAQSLNIAMSPTT
jgi:hypothetical protein